MSKQNYTVFPEANAAMVYKSTIKEIGNRLGIAESAELPRFPEYSVLR